MSPRQILKHHHGLRGRLRRRVIRSQALGARKPCYVYTPPPAPAGRLRRGLPLVVFLRGHEREWVNPREDASRHSTVVQDLDVLVARGVLPPLVALMPGMCSFNNHVHSCGVNMAGPRPHRPKSLGTGRFWSYLADEVVPFAERTRPEVAGGPRVAIGFSLGGFAAGLWAVRRPGAFDHVGLYDGTFPWPAFDDPRREGEAFSDRIFTEMGIFGPAFGPVGRRRAALRRWNPVDDLRRLDAGRLARLRRSTFWIASASRDGQAGNLDRTRRARDLLADRGVPLGFGADAPVSFHDHARHTYAWADRFAVAMLRRALG